MTGGSGCLSAVCGGLVGACGGGGSARAPFVVRYTALLDRFRFGVLALWLVWAAVGGAFAMRFIGATTQRFSPPPGSQSFRAAAAYAGAFPESAGSTQFAVLVTALPPLPPTAAFAPVVANFSAAVQRRLPALAAGTAVSSASYFALSAAGADALAAALVSPDGATVLLSVLLDAAYTTDAAIAFGARLAALVLEAAGAAGLSPANYDATMMGLPNLVASALTTIESDMGLMDGVVIPIALFVLALTVSAPRLVVAPAITAGATLAVSFGTMYFVTFVFVVTQSTPSLMLSLCLAMTIDYNLFFFSRYTAELRTGLRGAAAVANVLASSGRTIFVSGATLIISFLGLCFFSMPFITSIGVGCAFTLAVAVACSLSLVPALVLTFPGYFEQSVVPWRHTWVVLRLAACRRAVRRRFRRHGLCCAFGCCRSCGDGDASDSGALRSKSGRSDAGSATETDAATDFPPTATAPASTVGSPSENAFLSWRDPLFPPAFASATDLPDPGHTRHASATREAALAAAYATVAAGYGGTGGGGGGGVASSPTVASSRANANAPSSGAHPSLSDTISSLDTSLPPIGSAEGEGSHVGFAFSSSPGTAPLGARGRGGDASLAAAAQALLSPHTHALVHAHDGRGRGRGGSTAGSVEASRSRAVPVRRRGSAFYRLRHLLRFPWNLLSVLLVCAVSAGVGYHALHLRTTDSFSGYIGRGSSAARGFADFVGAFGYSAMFPFKIVFVANAPIVGGAAAVVPSDGTCVLGAPFFEFAQGFFRALVANVTVAPVPVSAFTSVMAVGGQWRQYSDVAACLSSVSLSLMSLALNSSSLPASPHLQRGGFVKPSSGSMGNGTAVCDPNIALLLMSSVGLRGQAMAVPMILRDIDPMGNDGDVFYQQLLRIADDYTAFACAQRGPSHQCNFTIYVDGIAPSSMDMVAEVYRSFPIIIGVTAGALLVIIGLAFRSLVVPLRAVVSIALTEGFVFGSVVLVYQAPGVLDWTSIAALSGAGAVSFIAPVVVFSVIVGLALDYDVFLVSRVAEIAQTERVPTVEAVLDGLCLTGGIITSAGCIMSVAFMGLLLSGVQSLNEIGFMLVTAALYDTFVVRTLLVPPLMSILGRWNWWPRRIETC